MIGNNDVIAWSNFPNQLLKNIDVNRVRIKNHVRPWKRKQTGNLDTDGNGWRRSEQWLALKWRPYDRYFTSLMY